MKRLRTYSLLIVEDNIKSQEQLKHLFEDHFREIFQAYDGGEGLQIYREHAPDIVLTDITMPTVDGLEMARAIKKINPQQPILLLSSHSEQETLLAAANIPVNGYITKPITDIDLLFDGLIRIADTLQISRDTVQTQIRQVRKVYQEKLETLYYRSHYDHLTRIPNRFLFIEHLTKALEGAKQAHSSVALFYIDLDHLKQINDRYGHPAGDYAIKMAVQNIQIVLDPQDMFARIGGDEFALVVETVDDLETLKALARDILRAASRTVHYNGAYLNLTCSIGISLYPQNTTQMSHLIDQADQAMYRAKSSGKNAYAFWGD